MKKYAVELTDAALAEIAAQARYIAVERQEPLNAKRWLEGVWDAVDSLESFPRRCAIAEEDEDASYEVRQVAVGEPLLLFTVDDDRRTVWVIALRGGGQLPRLQDLPRDIDTLQIEREIEALRRALIEGEESDVAGALDVEEIIRKARREAGLPPERE